MYEKDFYVGIAEKFDISILQVAIIFKETQGDYFEAAKRLIDECDVDKQQLGEFWGSYLGFGYVNPNESVVTKEYVDALGEQFIIDNQVLPLCKFGRAITIATSDPKNPYIQDKVEKRLKDIVSFVFCFPFDIEQYLRTH